MGKARFALIPSPHTLSRPRVAAQVHPGPAMQPTSRNARWRTAKVGGWGVGALVLKQGVQGKGYKPSGILGIFKRVLVGFDNL